MQLRLKLLGGRYARANQSYTITLLRESLTRRSTSLVLAIALRRRVNSHVYEFCLDILPCKAPFAVLPRKFFGTMSGRAFQCSRRRPLAQERHRRLQPARRTSAERANTCRASVELRERLRPSKVAPRPSRSRKFALPFSDRTLRPQLSNVHCAGPIVHTVFCRGAKQAC